MTAPAKQLSDNNPGGTGLGQSATDLISFHGVTPVDQAAYIATVTASTTLTSIATALNSVLALLSEKGLMAAS